jgi:two-component system, OmpR family, aerobic respiration control sensor histidine kinase ArcB
MNKNTPAKETYQTALEYVAKKYSTVTGQINNSTEESKTIVDYVDAIIGFYDNLLACMPGNVYWLNKDSVLIGSNDNAARLMGLDRKDLIGKNYNDLSKIGRWKNDQAEMFRKSDEKVILTGEPEKNIDENIPMPRPDGTFSYYYTNRVPLYNENNEVIGVVGISVDITERKQLEKALEEAKKNAEAYLQNAVEQIPGDISWKDRNGVYLGCNLSFAKRVGCHAPHEVIGKTDDDLTVGKLSKQEKRCDKEVLEHGRTKELEETKQKRDGKKCVYFIKKSPLRDQENQIIGVIAISFDITDRRAAEQRRIDTLQAFGSIVAHEMRTPLLSISAGIEGIEMQLPILLSNKVLSAREELAYEKLSKLLNNIIFEIDAVGLVINMILENVKIAKTKKVELTNQSMQDCVTTALARYPLHKKHQGLIHFECHDDFIFLGEQNLFAHILFNLIKNALYFIDVAGKGTISIWTEKLDTVNLLHFKDTGPGIAKEDLTRVFEKFYSRRYHGVGLGLVFCKLAMAKFRGNITCYSELGEYTEFVLSFPRVENNKR